MQKAMLKHSTPWGPVTIDYTRHGQGTPLVLIMGIGCQRIHWPEPLIERLVGRGFEVLVFDNRDIGCSTWLDKAPRPDLPMLLGRRAVGMKVPAPYGLSDMAGDVAGLLDHVGWKAAHVCGVSMGGMIAQHLAIEHPERVLSLTSVMSTTGARLVSVPSQKALRALLSPRPTDAEAAGEWFLNFQKVVAGPAFPPDPELARSIGRRSFERGANPAGFARHFAAILASGDRTERLKTLRVPTLVLHGDADILVPTAGGKATAAAIPGARLRIVPGWGHSLPAGIWDLLSEELHQHIRSVPATS